MAASQRDRDSSADGPMVAKKKTTKKRRERERKGQRREKRARQAAAERQLQCGSRVRNRRLGSRLAIIYCRRLSYLLPAVCPSWCNRGSKEQ